MVKRIDKSVKGGNSATSRTGDDCSTPEPYSCTGNFVDDFAEIWLRSGLDKMYIPVIRPRVKLSPVVLDEGKENAEDIGENFQDTNISNTYTTTENCNILRPNIQVEFETEETKQMQINHAKEIYIRGWKIDYKILNVLQLCMLDRLQYLNFWNAGISESDLKVLSGFLGTLPCLRYLNLDANPMPNNEPFHLLFGNNISLQHLSLKCNKITEKGVSNICKVLADTNIRSPLLTLNLSFNHITDIGAIELAKALRMNRTLLSLSLASNLISDVGCLALAKVLQRFALSHEEVVLRRKLIAQHGLSHASSAPLSRKGDFKDRPNSNKSNSLVTAAKGNRGSSKKKEGKKVEVPEKTPKKEDKIKKTLVTNEVTKGAKGKKSAPTKEGTKRTTTVSSAVEVESTEPIEYTHPLLDPQCDQVDGKVYISGCLTLTNLNLSRNRIGSNGLKYLWTTIQYQSSQQTMLPTPTGLLKLSLMKNNFAVDHPTFAKIQDHLASRDPANKLDSPEEERQSIAS